MAGNTRRQPAEPDTVRRMFDLATAAVEAALAAGARYADARIMIVRYESMSAKNGVVEGLTQTETAGIGVRALIGSSWGFQATPELDRRRGPPSRGAGGGGGPGQRAGHRRADRPGPGAGRRGELVQPLRGAPARRRQHLRARRPARRRHHHHRRRRHPARPGQPPDLGHREVVRVERGQPHRPAHRGVRRGDGRHRHRRRRDAAPQLPRRARPVRHPGLGGRARDRPARQRPAHRRGGQGAARARRSAPRRPPRSSSAASRWRCRSTSRSATPSSSTASSAGRPPSPARRGSTRPSSGRCATAPTS